MIMIGMRISYQRLEQSKIKITNKEFIELLTKNTFSEKTSFLETLVDKTLEISNPLKRMSNDYTKAMNELDNSSEEESLPPTIYLYNTHQSEEYAPSTFIEFSINPTVIMNNYIIESILKKNGYSAIVEERSIKEILQNNDWNYSYSYRASRIYLEDSKKNYPSLEYFIDIHRDSLTKEKTTLSFEGKDYAKILFIVGLENPNYVDNLSFTEKIHNKINEYYPNLSKGIYQKGGYGVNGVYNQDFSPHTILIEIGGYENTTTEVLNSSIAFTRCFLEVIHE